MNIFSISSLTAFVVCELLAGFVYLKNPKNKVNIAFAIETFLIGIWTLFPFVTNLSRSHEEALLFTRLIYIAAIMIPPAFLFFVYSLIDAFNIKKEKIKLAFCCMISAIFLFNAFNPYFIKDVKPSGLVFVIVPGMMYHLFSLFFAATVVYGYIRMLLKYKAATRFKKNQLLYVLVAFVIAGVSGLIHFLSAYGIKERYPHDLFVILFAALVSYSIVKYRAIEVDVAFKRTMAYSFSASLLTGLFIIIVLGITNLFSTFAEIHSFRVSILAAFLIALLFNPLKNRVQVIIDRVFYKRSYDYYATIQQVSSTLASMFDLQKIFRFVGNIIYEVLGLENVYLLTASPGGGYEVVYHVYRKDKKRKHDSQPQCSMEGMRIGSRSGIIGLCRKYGDILVRDELTRVERDSGEDMILKIKADLDLFQAEAVVPVFVDGKLTALMVLGERLSGDMFTGEDINLLSTIADQTAIAIKNAALYKDKVNSERLASIGMMSATFAHEIRNPLTSLKTFAQLMPEKYNDAEFRDKFSKIVVGEIERIDGLISDLLDFSAEKKMSRVNKFNLVALVDEIVDYVRGKMDFEKKNIAMEKKYEEYEINMSGDAAKLKQAFINIVTNGYQAMNGEGVLSVRIKLRGRYVDVVVTDTGEGIHPDDIMKIFDPFVTKKPLGVGLGLAISNRIIEEHKGRIHVESKLSKGSTFTVSLPVRKK